MIQPLDHSKIPNMANLLPEFQDAAFDPGRRYSMPYTWLTEGIAWNKTKCRPASVRIHGNGCLTPTASISASRWCRNPPTWCASAPNIFGHSVNNIPDPMLAQIEQMLIRQKPHIKAFHQDNGQDLLRAGEVDLVMEYNGDIAQLMAEEGGTIPFRGPQ